MEGHLRIIIQNRVRLNNNNFSKVLVLYELLEEVRCGLITDRAQDLGKSGSVLLKVNGVVKHSPLMTVVTIS